MADQTTRLGDWVLAGRRLVKLRTRAELVAQALTAELLVLGHEPIASWALHWGPQLTWPGVLVLGCWAQEPEMGWCVRYPDDPAEPDYDYLENPRSASALWSIALRRSKLKVSCPACASFDTQVMAVLPVSEEAVYRAVATVECGACHRPSAQLLDDDFCDLIARRKVFPRIEPAELPLADRRGSGLDWVRL